MSLKKAAYKAVTGVFFLSQCWLSCTKDVIIPDLSGKSVKVLAPPDSFITTIVTITFWWEKIEDAEKYNLQIVSPSFNSTQFLFADTNLTGNKFTYTLSPGIYSWRVKGFNNASETGYATRYLVIDSTSDLSSQAMVIISPADDLISNTLSHTFKWQTLYMADDYRFEIATPDFNGTAVITPLITTADSAQHTFTSEGAYEWRVRAENSASATPYAVYSIMMDTTRPNKPVLVSPVNNAVLTDSIIAFYWDRGTTSGSTISDSLYLYADSMMNTVLLRHFTLNTSYTDTLNSGTYFWRLRSKDAASNMGEYSGLNKFTVQ